MSINKKSERNDGLQVEMTYPHHFKIQVLVMEHRRYDCFSVVPNFISFQFVAIMNPQFTELSVIWIFHEMVYIFVRTIASISAHQRHVAQQLACNKLTTLKSSRRQTHKHSKGPAPLISAQFSKLYQNHGISKFCVWDLWFCGYFT